MKKALRQGNYAALNLYILPHLAENAGLWGISPFPVAPEVLLLSREPDEFWDDGVRIDWATMPTDPRGKSEGFNHGLTAVHEIGHWLGLPHPFEGGCDQTASDFNPLFKKEFNDLPAQENKGLVNRDCDADKVHDSCPNKPGTDSRSFLHKPYFLTILIIVPLQAFITT